MLKKIWAVFTILSVISGIFPISVYAGDNYNPGVSINVNGRRIHTDSPPIIINDRTLVPVRGIFEQLGAQVDWDAATGKVSVAYGNTSISLQIGNPKAEVNGAGKTLDVAPRIYKDRTMIPLRFISESMGMVVGWVPVVKVATITEPDYFDKLPAKTVLGYTTNDYVGDSASYNSLVSNAGDINAIATFSYGFGYDGKLVRMGEPQSDSVEFANSNNIKPLMLVHNLVNGNFDKNLSHAVLSNAAKRAALEDDILMALGRYEYAGVNIDIENIPWYDRQNYSDFVKELHDKLKTCGFLTTLSIPAKTSDDLQNGWNGAFDYSALGRYADRILLMTYDEHYFGSSPGPVASLPWVENVVKYASLNMPSNKILLGIPGYGYDWSSEGTRALPLKTIENMVSQQGIQVFTDAVSQTPHFDYYNNGILHEVWYEDSDSILKKLDLVGGYNLGGIGIWRLGYDNGSFWAAIRQKLG